MAEFVLRPAVPGDEALILHLIKKLAEYEKMLHLVDATEETLRISLFEQLSAEALVGEEDGDPVAYALFFHNFSTFLGRRGLYLEDIFVLPEKRGQGYGKRIFRYLAALALERGCGRMEWTCLDWNAPSIAFYKSIGAVPQEEWTIYRLDEQALAHVRDGL